MPVSSSSPHPCLKSLCSKIVNSGLDFSVRLRLFETWVSISPASSSSRSQAWPVLRAAPAVRSILPQRRWRRTERRLVPPFMLYCALGIHVDESGSPEERQSGDGTSFPESPDLSHVGTTAAFHHLANQPLANLMLFA